MEGGGIIGPQRVIASCEGTKVRGERREEE